MSPESFIETKKNFFFKHNVEVMEHLWANMQPVLSHLYFILLITETEDIYDFIFSLKIISYFKNMFFTLWMKTVVIFAKRKFK